MGERYVAVEVKLATNQLTLIVWIISVACLVGWLLRQTVTILPSSQHGGLLIFFLGNRHEELALTKRDKSILQPRTSQEVRFSTSN